MIGNRVFLIVISVSIILGSATGYFLSSKSPRSGGSPALSLTETAKSPDRDTKTFRDFAEGTIQKRPSPKNSGEYTEGTHLLVRSDNPTPVALTSSVVDLSLYEGKKVKVYGETQKAVKEGWLMDVGKVEVQ